MDLNFPNLNNKQREAVYQTEGPVLILAGAGSGKTTVLINRVAYLLEAKGVSPYSILAITFTNKAAAELKERLSNMLGPTGEGVWASTFHSLCVRILRRDIEKISYPSQFNIFDRADQLTVVKECLKELNLDEKMFPHKGILNTISQAKDELITPEEFKKKYELDFRNSKIASAYELYQKKLKKYGALDFDDIIVKTVELFQQYPEVLKYYQNKFRYIMVDEYQDTNHAQYVLVSLLAGGYKNLCVVGDDDQSIYKFRGADIENILSFEKEYPDAKVIKLEENYRSTNVILDAANNVISNNKGRKGKNLWTKKTGGERISVYQAQNEHDEGRYIAEQIFAMRDIHNYSFNDFAILYRTNAQSRVIENMLTREAIPYRVLGGLRFFDRKEIKDILAYLKLINNPSDNVSLKRIINEPKRGIGKTTVEKAEATAILEDKSMFSVCSEISGKPQKFTEMINDLREKVDTVKPSEFVNLVLEKTGYIEALIMENTVEATTRIENIKELLSDAMEYEKSEEEPTLSGYLEKISLVADVDNYDETQDVVVLMTLHSAKGLEFPVVFIAGVEEGLFPSYMSIATQEELEEERRLCYVGITRAKDVLYITNAYSRTLYGSTMYNKQSRFIDEIPEELTEQSISVKPTLFDSFDEKPSYGSFGNFYREEKPKQSTPSTSEHYESGMRVKHKKFGEGTILKATSVGNDWHLEIIFDTVGTKNLMAAYANLTII